MSLWSAGDSCTKGHESQLGIESPTDPRKIKLDCSHEMRPRCSRKCSDQSTKKQSRTTSFNSTVATHSIENSHSHSISIDFNWPQNLVRDRRVEPSLVLIRQSRAT